MAKPEPTNDLLAEFLPDALSIEARKPPAVQRLTLYALLALIVTAVIWATVSQLDKLVSGRGRIVTPLPNLVVQPLEPGILSSIEVRIGQIVRQGSVLATLDPTFASADAAQLGLRSNTLNLQASRLESELDGNHDAIRDLSSPQARLQADLLIERQAMYDARIRQYDENLQRLRASLETNTQDQRILASRLQSLSELETMQEELLGRQFGSRARLLEIQERRFEVERDYLLAKNRDAEIRREITSSTAEREAFEKAWRQDTMERLSNAMQQRDEIDEQLRKARLRSELVRLTSPADAIVLEIGPKSVGSVVRDAEALFTLVPIDAELEVELEIATADIGHIRRGDPVRIKLDAYPFQKHGTLSGTVTNISADAFSHQTAFGSTYHYLVRVSLDDNELKHLDTTFQLLPGMTLSGEIKTGTRSAISYFLYPVIRVLDESLRER